MVVRSDLYFDDVPYEIFYDDNGREIGMLFKYYEPEWDWPPRRKRKVEHTTY